MKTYFTKYLPVDGDIKEGDSYQHFTGRIYHDFSRQATYKNKGDKKVKLFLCSRDIQVGDTFFVDRDDYKSGPHISEGIIDERGHIWHPNIKEEPNYTLGAEESVCYKVIGEISPNATWVKEGDEFLGPEAGVKCEVFPIHDHDDETEEMIFTDKYGKKVDTPIYLIKGPCGHFH